MESHCIKCRTNGVSDYKWAYFDKSGALMKGECVHGIKVDTETAIEPDELIDSSKVFIDSEGIA